MHRQMLSLLLLLFIIFVSGCSFASTDAPERTVIRIAYLPITHSAAVMLLPEVSRYDENFRIELVRFTAWPEVVEALRAGRVDGASMLFEVAVTAYLRGSPLTAVSLSHRDGNVIVVDNSIESFHDLIGKTVAIPHAMSPHKTLLSMVLHQEGIDINDINLLEISPAEMPFSMAARAISAYVVAEPWGTLAEIRGTGHILAVSNDIIPGSVCCLLVFNTEVLEGHEGLFHWILENFELAAASAGSDREAVFNAFRRSSNFDREIIVQSLLNTTFENLTFTQEDFDFTTSNIERYGVLHEFPDFHDFVAADRRACHE